MPQRMPGSLRRLDIPAFNLLTCHQFVTASPHELATRPRPWHTALSVGPGLCAVAGFGRSQGPALDVPPHVRRREPVRTWCEEVDTEVGLIIKSPTLNEEDTTQ